MIDSIMNKIALVSRYVQVLLVFVATIHIGSYFFVLMSHDTGMLQAQGQAEQSSSEVTVRAYAKLEGTWSDYALMLEEEGFNSVAILGWAELLPAAFGYGCLILLFANYRKAEVFSVTSIKYIKYFGASLLSLVIIKLIYPIIVTLIIRGIGWSSTLPLSVSFGSSELTYLLSGLIIYVIAWIMQEAASLKQEQDLVV